MGSLNFLLPSNAPPESLADLDRGSVTGAYDGMPTPTRAERRGTHYSLHRDTSESGSALIPWDVAGAGRILCPTATLIQRPEPYRLSLELARGKLNLVRGQAADWRMVGLQIPPEVEQRIREASAVFGQAATASAGDAVDALALDALSQAARAANQLVRVYISQMLQARHQRQAKLDTALAIRINGVPAPAAAPAAAAACNSAVVPLTWRFTEPSESQYRWDAADAVLDWATRARLQVCAGPLVDASAHGLPEWLNVWDGDLPSLSSFMCDYVETVVGRYHRRIRRWQLISAANCATVLQLGEDDWLWLTSRLAEAAWQVDPDLELTIGIAQPWGDYLGREGRTYSPVVYADMLIRSGLRFAALDLEWIMGVSPRGSYCRDLLDASRLLDLYALLGVPLKVTLAYPSATTPDALADPAQCIAAGHWVGGISDEIQADWTADFAALALCKPYVRAVTWAHLSDTEQHQFPNAGLLNAAGAPKTALTEFQHLRQEHLN
jgi:hypothetical protein